MFNKLKILLFKILWISVDKYLTEDIYQSSFAVWQNFDRTETLLCRNNFISCQTRLLYILLIYAGSIHIKIYDSEKSLLPRLPWFFLFSRWYRFLLSVDLAVNATD